MPQYAGCSRKVANQRQPSVWQYARQPPSIADVSGALTAPFTPLAAVRIESRPFAATIGSGTVAPPYFLMITKSMIATTRSRGFNPHIHGLRGLAAFMVFWCHVYAGSFESNFYPEQWHPLLAWALHAGRYGVDLFFMISGYLITESLTRKGQVGRFLTDRVIRIYPAFLSVLIPLVIMGMLTQSKLFAVATPETWPFHILANLLFLPGVVDMPPILGVAWSLSFEAAFYITAALAFVLARAGRKELAVAVCATAGLLLLPQYPGVVFFYVGAFIYLFRDALLLRVRDVHFPMLSLLAFLALWHWFIVSYHRTDASLSVSFIATLLVCFALGLMFFNSVVAGAGAFGAFLRSGFLQFMGTISYSFYLWHTPVMYFTKRLVQRYVVPEYGDVAGTLAFAALSLPPALLLSYFSYRIFERAAGRILHQRFLPASRGVAASQA